MNWSRRTRRVVLGVIGWTLLLLGFVELVLPGPGTLIILASLLVLSQEFEWAKRRIEPVRLRALRAAAANVETWPRILLSLLGVLLLAAVGVLWTVHPGAPGWWPLAERWWLVGGWESGAGLLVSASAALATLAYSYRRFHGHPAARIELEEEIDDADLLDRRTTDRPDDDHRS